MKNLIWIALLWMLFTSFQTGLQAQEVILENETEGLYDEPTVGKNRRYFSHNYLSYGAFIQTGASEGLKTNPWVSYQVQYGIRQKLKLSGFYAMGLDISVRWDRYRIVQDETNSFPDPVTHKKEVFGQNSLKGEYFNRFNFDVKRGDHIGKYLDLGIWGSWIFSSKHIHWDEFETPVNGASRSRTTLRGLDYFEPWQWGLGARLGFNRYVVFGSYRMSSIFNEKKVPTPLDPGRWLIGVELDAF